MKILISRDSKGKIRIANLELNHHQKLDGEYYTIDGETGLYKGKLVPRPEIYIGAGKVKRTLKEQAELEFNSIIKKYKDKGYKDIEDLGYQSINDFDPEKVLSKEKKDQQGVIKPMLCKSIDDIPNKKIYDEQWWWASRKINGVRCLMYYKDGNVHTSSRGSVNYDVAISHILENQKLISFFKKYPKLILDGEIYHHNSEFTLNVISGICRKSKERNHQADLLEFYWYDIVDLTKPFKDRYLDIIKYSEELGITFDPYRKYSHAELQIQPVPHQRIQGIQNIYNLHDEFVKKGWEGVVIRNENSLYQPGSRNSDWTKVKKYKDAEYKIVELQEGLRDEDLCFILETENHQKFACKPMGTREQKQEYRNNISNIIGKYLTIKYFEMSGVKGSEIPQQPIGICIRDYE